MAPALSLHGYPVSQYFNAVRAALIEKGVTFEIVVTRAAQDDAFLTLSAMGKIPYLNTPNGSIAETVAILEFIEEIVDGVTLYPVDAMDRARARQIINIVQVYVEAPLRSLFPGVFMGGRNDPATLSAVRPVVERAMRALTRLVSFRPFLVGETITHADIFAFYVLDVGERVTRFAYDWSLLDSVPGLFKWHAMISDRPSSRIVLADFSPAFAAYLKDKAAAWHEPELEDHDYA